MNNYEIKDKKIIFSGGKELKFEFPILKSLDFDDNVVVVLDILGNTIYNRNIFGIDFNAEIKWQIEKSENLDLIGYCPFISIYKENLDLIAFNWCGFRYTIDPKNGKILTNVFTK